MSGDSLATSARANLAQNHETTQALSAQVKAATEARYIMALQRPRDLDMVRVRILNDCKRPRFAQVARYRRPVGKKKNESTGRWEDTFIEGPSIRFAESAIRAMGNIDVQTITTFDSPEKRIIQVSATDLETNAHWARDITVSKVVERKSLKKGQQSLGERLNSYGDTVYLVAATDGEFATKEAAEISKAVRTLGLRHVPADILDEAMDMCIRVASDEDAKDPDAARKAVVDAFAGIGVKPPDLAKYLGQDVGSCSPAQIGELRALFNALRAGEFTWAEVMAPAPTPEEKPDGGKSGAKQAPSIRERIRERAAKKAEAQQQASSGVIDTAGEEIDEETGEVIPREGGDYQ
ncbi:MAG: hypothetical protein ACWGPR_10805 [Candidatus Deferrimicrobiaceae bacterium]